MRSVALVGEFNGWKSQPMTKGSDETWRRDGFVSAGHTRLQIFG